jgi:hypothetical protein
VDYAELEHGIRVLDEKLGWKIWEWTAKARMAA